MANRCSQTIELCGPTDKISEVQEYVKSLKKKDYDDGSFWTDVFPISSCIVEGNKIFLETKWTPASITNISKEFPDVGFCSYSFTDGEGIEEVFYMIEGRTLYSVYLAVQTPEYWESVTGTKMKEMGSFNYRKFLKRP